MRVTVLLFLIAAAAASAHNGPPFGIIVDRHIGPLTINVWANPDIGTGTFFVFVDAPPGGKVPDDLKVEIAAVPISHRLPEDRFSAKRQQKAGQVEFDASKLFDRQEFWRFRVILSSAQVQGEAAVTQEVTPIGLGRWDLLLFAIPFLAVGFLWFRVFRRKNPRRKTRSA